MTSPKNLRSQVTFFSPLRTPEVVERFKNLKHPKKKCDKKQKKGLKNRENEDSDSTVTLDILNIASHLSDKLCTESWNSDSTFLSSDAENPSNSPRVTKLTQQRAGANRLKGDNSLQGDHQETFSDCATIDSSEKLQSDSQGSSQTILSTCTNTVKMSLVRSKKKMAKHQIIDSTLETSPRVKKRKAALQSENILDEPSKTQSFSTSNSKRGPDQRASTSPTKRRPIHDISPGKSPATTDSGDKDILQGDDGDNTLDLSEDGAEARPRCSAGNSQIMRPEGFSPVTADQDPKQIFLESLKETDEVWLIKSPGDFDMSKLNGESLTLQGHFKCQEYESFAMEDKAIEERTNLCTVLPSRKKQCYRLGPSFHGQIHMMHSYEVPTAPSVPATPPTGPKIPAGLRVRYTPFGADSPVRKEEDQTALDSVVDKHWSKESSRKDKKKKKSKHKDPKRLKQKKKK